MQSQRKFTTYKINTISTDKIVIKQLDISEKQFTTLVSERYLKVYNA